MGDLKLFDLKNIKDKRNTNVLIETGTFRGEGTAYAADTFGEVHSIEIHDGLYNAAVAKFKDNDAVTIHHGNSLDILPDLLTTIDDNILFWLDAHFPGADCHEEAYDAEQNQSKRVPLSQELKLIHDSRDGNDVIIVDDLWLYEDGPFEWGSWDDHSKKHGFNVTRDELMHGESLTDIIELLSDTHDVQRRYEHQGYLIFTPTTNYE